MNPRSHLAGLLIIALAPVSTYALQTTVATAKQDSPVAASNSTSAAVKVDANGQNINVMIDGELFTTFDYKSYDKPILYPIYSPGQIAMTRDWPMNKETAGESHDHPHHKSMWIAHEISGVDFWTEKGGAIETQSIETSFAGKLNNFFRSTSSWKRKPDNKITLRDQTTYWFGGDQTSRWINCLINFRATHGDLRFEDSKEGLFAIRTHPDLRLTANLKTGVKEVFGKAINSEGITGIDMWGKRAKWLLYYGQIDGAPVSIAMFDHPTNLRHPTTWHARDYGLITANPFGLHHFLGKEKGAGEFLLKHGESLQLRYRVEFFKGIATPETVEQKYQAFAKENLAELP